MPRRPGYPTAGAMVLAMHPLMSAVVLAGAYAAWHWGLEGLVAGGVGLAVQGAFQRLRGPRGLPGPLVTPSTQPELAALVTSVAERVGFREPLAVALVPVPEAVLGRTRLHGTQVVSMLLGLPLVRHLSEAQLAVVPSSVVDAADGRLTAERGV